MPYGSRRAAPDASRMAVSGAAAPPQPFARITDSSISSQAKKRARRAMQRLYRFAAGGACSRRCRDSCASPGSRPGFCVASGGSVIGRVLRQRYDLVRIRGEGAVAIVYGARDRAPGARVAVKVMERPAGTRRKHLVPRFQREATAAMSLDSPYVTRVFEHGSEGDMLFLVM